MLKGVVQFFLEDKGYGYIRVLDTREEFYVHHAELLEPIKKGDWVMFEVKEDRHGLKAKKVQLLKNQ